jgi:acyl-CoA thioester hydrolase
MALNTELHCFSVRVYAEDTDMMGIVYHSNYLCFFERARTEILRENGVSLTTMANYDTHFAIHDVHIRYLYPARLDDVLSIRSSCRRVKASTVEFTQSMYSQSNVLLSEAKILVVCVTKNLKPKRLSAEHFKSLLNVDTV